MPVFFLSVSREIQYLRGKGCYLSAYCTFSFSLWILPICCWQNHKEKNAVTKTRKLSIKVQLIKMGLANCLFFFKTNMNKMPWLAKVQVCRSGSCIFLSKPYCRISDPWLQGPHSGACQKHPSKQLYPPMNHTVKSHGFVLRFVKIDNSAGLLVLHQFQQS